MTEHSGSLRVPPALVTSRTVQGHAEAVAAEGVVVRRTLPAWALGPFTRPHGVGPVIRPDSASTFDCPMRGQSIAWSSLHAFNPAATVHDGRVFLLYRAEDDTGEMAISRHTSRLGLAESADGLRFRCDPAPVFYPDHDDQKHLEWHGGCEDPRLVQTDDGRYVLTYTQWDGSVPRLAVATSHDLRAWVKHGPAFARVHGDKYHLEQSKAGSIVCQWRDGALRACRVGGKYWMYWGEVLVRLAWSDNLLDWTIVEDAAARPRVVMAPRPGTFESLLVEPGPPALLTRHGILLLYNAKNNGDHTLSDLGDGAYAAGQALFDAADPSRLLDRLDEPFLQPATAFERTGQYDAGTTFIEGLVYFRSQWMLYYGCADSMAGIVVCPGEPNA